MLPVAGFLADRVSPAIMIPIAFSGRACIVFFFVYFVDHPDSVEALLLSVLMMMFSLIEGVVIMSTYNRTLPSDIRGAMIGVQAFFA
jgi:nitrate/nitrite transporter NarK